MAENPYRASQQVEIVQLEALVQPTHVGQQLRLKHGSGNVVAFVAMRSEGHLVWLQMRQ